MAVDAVFDMSIEAIIEVVIKPINRLLGVDPEILRVNLNNASSNLVLVIAVAMKKPPSMSQITLLENVATYCSIFSVLALKLLCPKEKTRKATIKILTAKGGTASVNHRPIAKNNIKSTYTCVNEKEASLTSNVNNTAIRKDSVIKTKDLVRLPMDLILNAIEVNFMFH